MRLGRCGWVSVSNFQQPKQRERVREREREREREVFPEAVEVLLGM